MPSDNQYSFHNEADLLDRLTDGIDHTGREVVFVVGAPLTASPTASGPGVANVDGVIGLIRSHFASDGKKLADLDSRLERAANRYQQAFIFLQGRRGQDVANRIIRQAVWQARRGSADDGAGNADGLARLSESDLERFEEDPRGWHLSPAVESLGALVTHWPKAFGRSVITSNFDPLIQVSVRAAGGRAWRTALHADGTLGFSQAEGCEVIHIHGYWRGSDTLHTGDQLLQRRPNLQTSLVNLLAGKTVVVLAYGGWDDIFMQALEGLVSNPGAFPEVIWTFRQDAPKISDRLASVLQPGIDRSRVAFYSGIDCHSFLPKLVDEWRRRAPPVSPASASPHRRPAFLSKLDCDRPPSIETWVGRDEELAVLAAPASRLVALCGIGGQGKSLLAARHLARVSANDTEYDCWDWRDCREQGDRLRSQIVAAIERISEEEVTASDLAEASDTDLVEVFIRQVSERRAVFIFDNVDHYVDLEREKFTGLLDQLARAFCRTATSSQMIMTCRPTVRYESASAVTLVMRGLSLEETHKLFQLRLAGRFVDEAEIARAHQMTDGHAFWLDLMAAHVARAPERQLRSLLEDIRRGRGDTPDVLSPIWEQLPEREKFVLRTMAEAVRPETEETIQYFVAGELSYQKFMRALRSLISLNLVVVKTEQNSPDLYDLHPLVRQFVKQHFARPERAGVIKGLLKHYEGMIKSFAAMLGVHMPYSLMERYPQQAELEIEAGLIDRAFATLDKAHDALVGSGHNEEYIRVARRLFENLDWAKATSIKHFDSVLADYVVQLDDSDQRQDADDIIKRYEQTIPAKTARFIKYCDIRCHSHWTRGEYEDAVEWGRRGDNLKNQSHVDTQFDCVHNLALAMRDGGDPVGALPLFLKSHTLESVIARTEHDAEVNAPLQGNVGRCLFKLGRLEDALRCLRVSALVLEDDDGEARLSNQAYAREWIGETLESLGDLSGARAFFAAAADILAGSLPVRGRRQREQVDRLNYLLGTPEPTAAEAHRAVGRWLRQPVTNHFKQVQQTVPEVV